ncbi:MAG: DnaB-like helicase N-terminal domain-containing protein [Xenococcus sp. (in: cyanobacteria)]
MKNTYLENEMPLNIEAEEAILGGILLDPNAFDRVESDLSSSMFTLRSHQLIYKSFVELKKKGRPTDLLAVTNFLSDRKILDAVGGVAKLSQLLNRTVSAANIDRYAQLVIDKWKRRELINLGHKLIDLGYRTELGLEELKKSINHLVVDWLNEELADQTKIGKITYTAIAKQENENYEEIIKLESEINLNSDPNAQIKKLQEQAQELFNK